MGVAGKDNTFLKIIPVIVVGVQFQQLLPFRNMKDGQRICGEGV